MPQRRGFLQFASILFKIVAVVIAVAVIIGAAVQFAIFAGFFPADFYYNSNVSTAQRFLGFGALGTLCAGAFPVILFTAIARTIDVVLKVEQRAKQ